MNSDLAACSFVQHHTPSTKPRQKPCMNVDAQHSLWFCHINIFTSKTSRRIKYIKYFYQKLPLLATPLRCLQEKLLELIKTQESLKNFRVLLLIYYTCTTAPFLRCSGQGHKMLPHDFQATWEMKPHHLEVSLWKKEKSPPKGLYCADHPAKERLTILFLFPAENQTSLAFQFHQLYLKQIEAERWKSFTLVSMNS